ncbi:MAG TPA: hypothetical protein VGM23_06565 [Armatimonadota bacterium]
MLRGYALRKTALFAADLAAEDRITRSLGTIETSRISLFEFTLIATIR